MESITIVIAVMMVLLGAVFGSFAGAAVWRIRTRKDIVNDRSECEHCKHKLGALDLIPIVSWLALRGNCRYCHKPIGWSALFAEMGLGAYFALSYLLWPYEHSTVLSLVDFGLWLALGIGLTILFIYDLRWYLLPDRVVFTLIGLGTLDFGLRAVARDWSVTTVLIELVLALGAVAGVYGLIYLISKGEWVGFGDVKLGVVMGLVLGWQAALLAVLIANIVGTLIILPGLLSGKLSRRTRVPFGPFLIIGLVLAGLFGAQLIDWYLGLLGSNL